MKQSSPVSIKVARQEWLKKIDETIFDPAVNTIDPKARLELTKYFLTGQLLDSDFGSVVMFNLPLCDLPCRSRNESCFHSVDFQKLVNAAKSHNGDFVAGVVSLFRARIQRLKSWIDTNMVSIQIEPPTVVTMTQAARIKSLDPYSISWNNCVDYMTTKDFHRLARACSADEDTVHYGYSMNWPQYVQGTFSMTYPHGKQLIDLLERCRKSLTFQAHIMGSAALLQFPPFDNPYNILDTSTQVLSYPNWKDAFFKDVKNVGYVEPPMYNCFARTHSCLFFSWAYDEKIQFLSK